MEFDFRDWYDKIDVPSLGKEVINSFLIEQGFTSRSSLLTLTEADIPDAFGDQDIKIGWKRSLLQNIQSSIKNGDEVSNENKSSELNVVEELKLMKNKIEEIMKMISDDKSDKSNGKVELRQRLSESNSSYSTDSIEHAVSLRNLAINHRAQGRIEEAVVAYEELVQLQRLLLGDSSSDTLESISDLASLYRYRSQYMKAQPLMEECLSAAIQTHGENHVNVVACKNNLANLLADCKKFAEAETLYLSCIVISQEQGGRSAALQYMNNLALLYADQGRVPEARALFEQCLDIGTREYGTDHPVVQGMRNNLRNLSQCRIN